jgi:hypothetical protein
MSEELDEKLESQKIEDEKTEVKEPEVKKEDTKALDVEVLKKALREELAESIRKEEKAKLYDSFEKYKNDARNAEEAKSEAETKLKEYETKNLSADEQSALKLKELEESNVKLQTQLTDLVELANTRINTLQLELAKKELISQYGDEIIPAYVSGNTLEELAESAEKVHRDYINIRDKELAKAKEATKTKDQIGTGLGPSSDKLNVIPSVADIKKIDDPKELEKLKAKLFG